MFGTCVGVFLALLRDLVLFIRCTPAEGNSSSPFSRLVRGYNVTCKPFESCRIYAEGSKDSGGRERLLCSGAFLFVLSCWFCWPVSGPACFDRFVVGHRESSPRVARSFRHVFRCARGAGLLFFVRTECVKVSSFQTYKN